METLHDTSLSVVRNESSFSAAPCFTKCFTEKWLFRATLFNSLRACVAASRSTWLQVPQVVRVNAPELRIDYELLTGWHPLHTILRDRRLGGRSLTDLASLFWCLGAALEELHRHTHRIHGDFDFDNILVKRGVDRAMFVDFTPPEYALFRRYNQADPYRDLAMLVLFVRAKYPPHLLYLAFRPELPRLARAFIAGYFAASPASFDRRRLEWQMNELLDTTYLGDAFAARYLRRTRLFRTDDLEPQ